MKIGKIQKAGLAVVLLAVAGLASANPIVRTYTATTGCGSDPCGTSGGEITFTDLGSNQLQIEFDNTSVADIDGTNINSAIITGLVFDILQDIEGMSVASFVDGNSSDLTSDWTVELNVDNNITPGNTVVDMSITSNNGINGGIYNAADSGNTNNAFPDIATLVLDITDPIPWALLTSGISNDFLRMQRVGLNGEGSLKIPGGPGDDDDDDDTPDIPEPSILMLLGFGLAGVGMFRIRRRQS